MTSRIQCTRRCRSIYVYIHAMHTCTDPTILPRVQVDKGAIKFILSGANIMCPGLTSPGARMDVSLPEDTVVVSHIYIHKELYTVEPLYVRTLLNRGHLSKQTPFPTSSSTLACISTSEVRTPH